MIKQTKKILKKWMWIIGAAAIIIPIFMLILPQDVGNTIAQIGTVTMAFGIVMTIINFIIFLKFYDSLLAFMSIIVLALIFKFQHFPGADAIMLFGTLILIIVLIYAVIKFTIKNDLPRYINRFGIAASLIITIIMFALLFKINHYPGANYLEYISVSLLILIILALVFTLPSSGFVDWTKQSRKVFFRALMIPIAFLFLLTATIKLYPETLNPINILDHYMIKMEKVDLFDKEGLAK